MRLIGSPGASLPRFPQHPACGSARAFPSVFKGHPHGHLQSWFRQDLIALFDLLQQQKIKPLIAQRFPLAEARYAHELLGKGVTSKIVRVRDG
jgi:NADPH:quinone reductase-like Zn-dependent oxidoreductase